MCVFFSSLLLLLLLSGVFSLRYESRAKRTADSQLFYILFSFILCVRRFQSSRYCMLCRRCVLTHAGRNFTLIRSLIPKERWNTHAEAPKQSNSNCRIVSIFSTVVRISFFVLKLCFLLGCFVFFCVVIILPLARKNFYTEIHVVIDTFISHLK